MPASVNDTGLIDGFWRFEVKPFGPVQLKVEPGVLLTKRFRIPPAHAGLLLATGVAGSGLIITNVLAGRDLQPFTVVVTLYVPPFAILVFVSVVFCSADVNELGPVHEYVAAEFEEVAFNVILLPSHTVPLLLATGVVGEDFTKTDMVSLPKQLLRVAVMM
jgi:hypothetical protein